MTTKQDMATSGEPTGDGHRSMSFGAMMASFDDHMEERHPGHKAREAEKIAERERLKKARRIELADELGDEEAIMVRTSSEVTLHEAVTPLVERWETWIDPKGRQTKIPSVIAGVDAFEIGWSLHDMPSAVEVAIRSAMQMPASLVDVLVEVKAWDRLAKDREAVQGHEWQHYPEVRAWTSILETALDASVPATSWSDVLARLEWKRYEEERGWLDPTERDNPFLDRLEADIRRLML